MVDRVAPTGSDLNTGRLRLFTREEDALFTEGLRLRAIALGWDPDEPLDMVFKIGRAHV